MERGPSVPGILVALDSHSDLLSQISFWNPAFPDEQLGRLLPESVSRFASNFLEDSSFVAAHDRRL
jgi:hypothetical protein